MSKKQGKAKPPHYNPKVGFHPAPGVYNKKLAKKVPSKQAGRGR